MARSSARRNFNSKWTAEYLVAAELSRRGYTLAFTQGSHTPDYDLIIAPKHGAVFKIDVKGQAAKGSWLLRPKENQDELYYVLVYAPPGEKPRPSDRFFILTQQEANDKVKAYDQAHPNQKSDIPGFDFRDVATSEFEDRWDKLPAVSSSNIGVQGE